MTNGKENFFKIMEKIKNVGVFVASYGMVLFIAFSGYFYIEKRYAHRTEYILLEKRLEIKITSDKIANTEERLWVLQDRLKLNPNDQTVIEGIRTLESFKKEQEQNLINLNNNIKK